MANKTFLGIFGGIGAMGIYFQQQGWECLGNIETRKIHTYRGADGLNTFEEYFGAPLFEDINEFCDSQEEHDYIDLVFAQPKCGGFSNLYGTGRKPTDKTTAVEKYGADILWTIKAIAELQPGTFYMDNLAKSLQVVTPEMWREMLPGYELQFEWVSNYHYGNPQKGRNRLFVIGSRVGFRFTPQELTPGPTVCDRIGDLFGKEGEAVNHDIHSRTDTDNITNLAEDTSWGAIAAYVRRHTAFGENLPYRAKDGTIKRRIGSNRLHWDKHSHTLAGIKGAKFHPLSGFPISIRERCRLQGYPDDFIIRGTKFMPDGTWSLRKNSYPVRQLNNTVPYEFTAEFGRQLCYYLAKGKLLDLEPVHAIKPNPIIEEANK